MMIIPKFRNYYANEKNLISFDFYNPLPTRSKIYEEFKFINKDRVTSSAWLKYNASFR
jgi:hypothetical protein